MAYDFSKQKVSVKELDKKRSDAVAASRSSGSSSSSTPTPAPAPTPTASETWSKDVVTLEEAKQQTRDVERGVIDVERGTTSTAQTQTEKISLAQAAAQTQTEKRITAAEQAQRQNPYDITGTVTTTRTYDPTTGQYTETKETVREAQYSNISPIKAGSNIRSAAQLDPVTKTERQTETKTYNLKVPREDLKPEDPPAMRTLTPAENASLKTALLVDKPLSVAANQTNTTSTQSRELAAAYEQQDTRLYNASRLGALEPVVSGWEKGVEKAKTLAVGALDSADPFKAVNSGSYGDMYEVEPKRGSQTAPAKFVISAAEAVALTPSAIPRLAASAVREPALTAQAMITEPIKAVKADPASGLGSIAGMVIGARVVGGAVKVGKTPIQETQAKLVIQRSMEQKAKTITSIEPSLKAELSSAAVKVERLQNIKQEPVIGKIRSPESFQVRNIVESHTSPGRTLRKDTFTVEQQINTNRLAKVERPETSPNYYRNTAELGKYRKDGEFIGYDTKPHVRPTPDSIDVPKVKPAPVKDSIGVDTKNRFKPDEAYNRVPDDIILKNELADAQFQKEYFFKKNMRKLIEDERGELRLEVLIKPETRISPQRAISERLKPATVESRAKAFKNPRSEIKSGIKQRSKPAIVPMFKTGITPAQAARQNIQLTPRQTIVQTQVQRQTVSQKQLQTTRQATSQLQDTALKEALRTSTKPRRTTQRGPEYPKRKVVEPVEASVKMPRSAKATGSKAKVKLDTIRNVFEDPMKALARRRK